MANPVLAINKGQIIQVPNMRVPEVGSNALPITADFSATAALALDGSFQDAFDTGQFELPQSVYIDNGINPAAVTLSFPGVGTNGQNVTAPPYSQGYYQISPPTGDPRFTVATVGGVKVQLVFYNVPTAYCVWSTQDASGGNVQTGAFTARDNKIAAGGTSQVLAAANPTRRQLIIENPLTATGQGIGAAESLYINFTGPAGVDNGTSIEIVPGGSYVSGNPVSSQAVTVNAATIGHVYIAKEM